MKGIETMQPRLKQQQQQQRQIRITLHCNITTEAYACTTFGTANVKCHIHQTKEVLMILS